MLLSDVEIKRALADGELAITPEPGDGSSLWQPASVDLRLGSIVSRFKEDPNTPAIILNLALLDVGAYLKGNTEDVDISGSPLVLEPGAFVLARTFERVYLSNSLSGRVEGRSRLARMGLAVHVTAPKIDPGFDNVITLEMFHVGKRLVSIEADMPICTLLIERLGETASQGYEGGFQGR